MRLLGKPFPSLFPLPSTLLQSGGAAPPSAPDAPVITSPTNGQELDSNGVTMTWDAVDGATSYTLHYDIDSGFSDPTIVTGIADVEYTLPTLTEKSLNYVRVYAVNDAGTSAPSETVLFKLTPLAIRSGAHWWDVSAQLYQDSAGTTPAADGEVVGQLPDQLTGGTHFTGAGATRPTLDADGINSTPCLVFTGAHWLAADAIATALSGTDVAFSLAFYGALADLLADYVFIGAGKTDNAQPIILQDFQLSTVKFRHFRRSNSGSADSVEKLLSAADTSIHLFAISYTGTALTLRIDGAVYLDNVALDLVGALTLNTFTLGALRRSTTSAYLKGKIGDVVLESGVAWDAAVAGQMEDYLASAGNFT